MLRRTMQAVCLGLLVESAIGTIAPAAGRQSPETDVTPTHGFKDARLCTFQPGGERLFDGLEKLRYKQSIRISHNVRGLRLAVEGRRTSRAVAGGALTDMGATVAAPVDAIRWHGLPVRSFGVGYKRPAESDSLYWREVRLRASAAQVRATLGRLAVRVPADGYHRIKDDHPCGGALTVKSRAGETSIRCE